MFLIDNILAAPVRGLMFVMREVAKKARDEQEAEERSVMAELGALHAALDNGQVTEDEFDARESRLLTRLDRLRGVEPEDVDAPHGS